MIISIKGKFAEAVVAGKVPKGIPADVFRSAERRMQVLAAATVLDDLRSLPATGSKP